MNAQVKSTARKAKSSGEAPPANTVLNDCVRKSLETYFNDLDGMHATDLYRMVMHQVEAPMLEAVLTHTGGNQTQAAEVLGINRGTLRKKLKQYHLD
ncbi:MAG: DNA-binding transcriptional regulator Fis [Gammaproteobacteria bacterium]